MRVLNHGKEILILNCQMPLTGSAVQLGGALAFQLLPKKFTK